MLDAADAVIWIKYRTKQIVVNAHTRHGDDWADPIGAAYSQWQAMNDEQRVHLMLETAIELGMQGYALKDILTAFAEVRQFRALGSTSYPMARALTAALLGKCLEPHDEGFEEIMREA